MVIIVRYINYSIIYICTLKKNGRFKLRKVVKKMVRGKKMWSVENKNGPWEKNMVRRNKKWSVEKKYGPLKIKMDRFMFKNRTGRWTGMVRGPWSGFYTRPK